MKIPTHSAVLIILTVLMYLSAGCNGTKYDCQQNGHEWATGKSGEARCKHCGVYQSNDTPEEKKADAAKNKKENKE